MQRGPHTPSPASPIVHILPSYGTFNTAQKLTWVITVNYTADFLWVSPVFPAMSSFVPEFHPTYHIAFSPLVSPLWCVTGKLTFQLVSYGQQRKGLFLWLL